VGAATKCGSNSDVYIISRSLAAVFVFKGDITVTYSPRLSKRLGIEYSFPVTRSEGRYSVLIVK
jgi:hypothetical protein